MFTHRVLEPGAFRYRLQYAIRTILRDRIANEGVFNSCFEMEDADQVIVTILRRGLSDRRLRAALEGSHLVNIHEWLTRYPDLAGRYYEDDAEN